MKIIGLVPVKNGEKFIDRFLKNSNIVDGFIILDDNSTDDTLNCINKLPNIIEVIKKNKTNDGFNDAYNRNLLLNIAKKHNPDYVFWIDIDEVWVDFLNIRETLLKYRPIQLYLPTIHLYNTDNSYIKTYPNSHFGVQWKCRIVKFSEYTDFSFSINTRLHFSLNPKEDYIKFYPMMIKHYGHFTEELREFKFNFYLKNDIQKLQSYNHLISKNHKFGSVEDIENQIKKLKYEW
jgi:hypothetical protein